MEKLEAEIHFKCVYDNHHDCPLYKSRGKNKNGYITDFSCAHSFETCTECNDTDCRNEEVQKMLIESIK